MTEPASIDFSDKVVLLYLKAGVFYPSELSLISLLAPRFEEQWGRVCLVGKFVGDESETLWHAEASFVCVFWEFVTCYLVFESVGAYRAAVKSAKPPKSAEAPAGRLKGGLFGLIRGSIPHGEAGSGPST